jgi:hypothetical protein
MCVGVAIFIESEFCGQDSLVKAFYVPILVGGFRYSHNPRSIASTKASVAMQGIKAQHAIEKSNGLSQLITDSPKNTDQRQAPLAMPPTQKYQSHYCCYS